MPCETPLQAATIYGIQRHAIWACIVQHPDCAHFSAPERHFVLLVYICKKPESSVKPGPDCPPWQPDTQQLQKLF